METITSNTVLIFLPLLLLFVQVTVGIIALIDIIKSDFKENDKIIWVIVILVLWLIGAILYYFIGRKQKLSP